MTVHASPFQSLVERAASEATGELICASPAVEVHVYLQRGRIAWATDSEHPFAFTRYLQRSAEIDPEAFRDILDSCRREKRPLGETLVSWGVTTHEKVRDALRHQIELALEVLRGGGPAQTVFLDRTKQFAQYDSTFTFDLSEIVPPSGGGAPETRRASRMPPVDDHAPRSAPPSRYARRLLDSVEGLLWAELLEKTTLVDSAPEASSSARFPRLVVESTILDGAELVALRSRGGTLAGVVLPGAQSLWCRLGADATVGAALSALGALGTLDRRSTDDVAPASGRSAPWSLGEDAAPLQELRDFFSRAPEALATVVTSAGDEAWAYGVGADGLDPEWALSLARRRARVLEIDVFDTAERESDEPDAGACFRSMMTAERRIWCFGAELATRPHCAVWLMLDRRTSQGLGWAYLTSLSRQLLHLRNWGRRG